MATTTLRVPEELKARIAALAERSGTTTHAFMLEALEDVVRRAEARAAFVAEAQDRYQELLESGRGIDWHDMRDYLNDRVEGRPAKAPRTRSWRK